MWRPFIYPKDSLCPDSRSLQAGCRGGEDITQDLNLESGDGLDSLDNIQESKFLSSEIPRPLSLRWGEALDLIPPTHPNISDLSQIWQEPTETVHHYWAIFLLVINKVKDCRVKDAISLFFAEIARIRESLMP